MSQGIQFPIKDRLGVIYKKGLVVPQDYCEAVKWLRKATEQGHAFGQQNPWSMYKNGRGVSKNLAEAYAW